MGPHAERDIASPDALLADVDFDLDCDTQIDVFVVSRQDSTQPFDEDAWPGERGSTD